MVKLKNNSMAKIQSRVDKMHEVKTYTFNGISVAVEIDYIGGKISLIDKKGCTHGASVFGPKQWVFAKRSLEYMQGWQNILDAMKMAIAAAEKELRPVIEGREKNNRKVQAHMLREVAKQAEAGR